MAQALIKFTQGATTDLAGRAVIGVSGQSVTVENGGSDTGITSWIIKLLYAPSGSAFGVPLTLATGGATHPTTTFTPDASLPGTFQCQLLLNGAVPTNIDPTAGNLVDTRDFIVPNVLGEQMPAFGSTAQTYNPGGTAFGYARALEKKQSNDTAWGPKAVAGFGADITGTSDATPAITNAFTSAQEATYTPGTYKISATTSIGAVGKTHIFQRGAKLVVAANQTLTVAGHVHAPPDHQIFDISASGSKVVFSSPGAHQGIELGWFGADPSGVADSATALQAAITAAAANGVGVVNIPPGTFTFLSGVTAPGNVTLRGPSHPAGGVNANANYGATLIHNFSGDFITFTGTNGIVPAVGGGVERLRLVQQFGGASDGTPRGKAIKFIGADSSHMPQWFRIWDCDIEESINSPWTYAIEIDGTSGVGAQNIRISEVNTHTGTGALGSINLKGVLSAKLLSVECHDTEGDILVTGTVGVKSVGIEILGGDAVDVIIDWASQVRVVGGDFNSITTTANTTGPNYFAPGKLTLPFVDSSADGQVGATWLDPTNLVNPAIRFAPAPPAVNAGQYYQGAHTSQSLTISGATNASPIVIQTTTSHGLSTGAQVKIAGVLGNLAANGTFFIIKTDATHFSLNGSTGNGAYTSGGTAIPTSVSVIGIQSSGGVDRITLSPNGDVPIEVGTSASQLGFLGATPITKQTLSQLRAPAGALQELVTALAALGLATDTTATDVISGTTLTITAASNASPIQITTSGNHGLSTNAKVNIAGVTGNTAANGAWVITFVNSTNFTLNGSTGNNAYVSGGVVTPAVSVANGGRVVLLPATATLSDMTGGYAGQEVVIVLQASGVKVDRSGSSNSGFILSNSTACTATNANATLKVVFSGTFWAEISRSIANG